MIPINYTIASVFLWDLSLKVTKPLQGCCVLWFPFFPWVGLSAFKHCSSCPSSGVFTVTTTSVLTSPDGFCHRNEVSQSRFCSGQQHVCIALGVAKLCWYDTRDNSTPRSVPCSWLPPALSCVLCVTSCNQDMEWSMKMSRLLKLILDLEKQSSGRFACQSLLHIIWSWEWYLLGL